MTRRLKRRCAFYAACMAVLVVMLLIYWSPAMLDCLSLL
jgi:hypothetical protein